MPPTSGTAPGSTASLRTANQQRVLDALRAGRTAEDNHQAFTQADLARSTGLAPATVSNIVRELVAAALVETDPGGGRRGTSVRLARSAGVVAGVDFGHSHVAVAIADMTGGLLAEDRRPLDQGHRYDEGLATAAEMLDNLRGQATGDVGSIGLGLPAPITCGVIHQTAIFPGWGGVDARSAAQEVFRVPVHVENDANLGALAEHRQGVARGHDTSVFVKISSGVGAGIIIDNELFHGSTGNAGEIGHLTLDEQGPICRCGSRGCLEAYTSVETVVGMMGGQLPGTSFDQIVDAARGGNVSAQRALEDAGLHLGWGLASIVNLINPAVVVVGGDMARAGDLLLDSARIGLRRHALDSVAGTPVVASALGERASLVGAVLLAAERTDLLTPPL